MGLHDLGRIADSLVSLHGKVDAILSGLTNLQAADTALQTEVTTLLADIVTALQNADSDADVQAVADNITNVIIPQLQGGDPVTGTATTPPATPPASPSFR